MGSNSDTRFFLHFFFFLSLPTVCTPSLTMACWHVQALPLLTVEAKKRGITENPISAICEASMYIRVMRGRNGEKFRDL